MRCSKTNCQRLKEFEDLDLEELTYQSLLESYLTRTGQPLIKAYLDSLNGVKNTLYKTEITAGLAEAEAKYQTKVKEEVITQQQLEIEKQTNARNRILFGAISVLLISGLIFNYLRNRQRLKNKEAELALNIKEVEAENLREIDQLKTRFFTNISHEFRTPLTLIKGPLSTLMEGSGLEQADKYYRMMDRNADRLLKLVNQLLDLAKLEGGSMPLQVAQGDISQFVRSIAYTFESIADRRQMEFEVDTPTSPLIAWFDADKLEKILVNLLGNAFKFTPEEGKIQLTLIPSSGTVKLILNDSGIGIATDQLPFIFDRFYQRDMPSAYQQPGTGVGLALTKDLIELMQGTIKVDSEEGKGTRFTVILPIEKDQFAAEDIVEKEFSTQQALNPKVVESSTGSFLEKKPPQPAPLSKKATSLPIVLIVEDNQDVRILISEQLKNNYHIIEAVNGRQGLETALSTVPDLIISDVMMPEMDGLSLLKALKTDELTSHIPVVMLTAKAEQQDKLEGLGIGADDYLSKPFDARELRVRAQNLIQQRRQLQETFSKKIIKLTADKVVVRSVDEVFLQKVKDCIESNIDDEGFSVTDLADALHMSRHQLHRKLKALIDQSPVALIRTLRLQRARQLLEQRVGNATEIAFMVGFSSPAYFSSCFHKEFGFPPRELLKRTL